jgi:hypothetical protein
MAFYLVSAVPKQSLMEELGERLGDDHRHSLAVVTQRPQRLHP